MRNGSIRIFAYILISIFTQIVFLSHGYAGSPCDGINRVVDMEHKALLEAAILKQLSEELKDMPSVEILESYKFGNWSIIFVETHVSDEPFLFYSGNPLENRYITIWSGAATIDEETYMKEWILKKAPGIPEVLANCFAWSVTKDQTSYYDYFGNKVK